MLCVQIIYVILSCGIKFGLILFKRGESLAHVPTLSPINGARSKKQWNPCTLGHSNLVSFAECSTFALSKIGYLFKITVNAARGRIQDFEKAGGGTMTTKGTSFLRDLGAWFPRNFWKFESLKWPFPAFKMLEMAILETQILYFLCS